MTSPEVEILTPMNITNTPTARSTPEIVNERLQEGGFPRNKVNSECSVDMAYLSDHVTQSDSDSNLDIDVDNGVETGMMTSESTIAPIDLSASTHDNNNSVTENHLKPTTNDVNHVTSTGSKSLYHSIQQLSVPSNPHHETYVTSGGSKINRHYFEQERTRINSYSCGDDGDVMQTAANDDSNDEINDDDMEFHNRNSNNRFSPNNKGFVDLRYFGYSINSYAKDRRRHNLHFGAMANGHACRDVTQSDGVQASFWNDVSVSDGTAPEIDDGIREKYCEAARTVKEGQLKAKRARMENIVSSLRASSPSYDELSPRSNILTVDSKQHQCDVNGTLVLSFNDAPVASVVNQWHINDTSRRSKRKRYVPQQHDVKREDCDASGSPVTASNAILGVDVGARPPSSTAVTPLADKSFVRDQLQTIEDRLNQMKAKCLMSFGSELRLERSANSKAIVENENRARNGVKSSDSTLKRRRSPEDRGSRVTSHMTSSSLDERNMIALLKAEIDSSVGILIDNVIRAFIEKYVDNRSRCQNAESTISREKSRDHANQSTVDNNNCETFHDRQANLVSFPSAVTSHMTSYPTERNQAHVLRTMPPMASLPVSSLPAAMLAATVPALPFSFPVDADDALRRSLLTDRLDSTMSRLPVSSNLNFDLPMMTSGSGFDQKTGQGRSATQQPNHAGVAYGSSNEANLKYLSNQGGGPHRLIPRIPYRMEPQSSSSLQDHCDLRKSYHGDAAVATSLMTKKKRTKVTDTRLSPRAARAMLHHHTEGLHKHRHHHHQYHNHHQHQRIRQDDQQQKLQHNGTINNVKYDTSPPGKESFYGDRQPQHQHLHHMQQQQQQQSPLTQYQHQYMGHCMQHYNNHQGNGNNDNEALFIRHSSYVADQTRHLSSHDSVQSPHAEARRSPFHVPHSGSSTIGQLSRLPVLSSEVAAVQRTVFNSSQQGSNFGMKTSSMEAAEFSGGADMMQETDIYDTEFTPYDGMDMMLKTTTLTPMHLRKAKLMFFYVRYPSSAILKAYFPDVQFNKNNTAQLVKWFSNFREFFYIQMEKYARQALAEGVKSVSDLVVAKDDELYRVLILHYNRNNQIEVPESFRYVVQSTLREFFVSIAAEKDMEQSWKKAIYKVIARLDDNIPEYFKSPNWMERLIDG